MLTLIGLGPAETQGDGLSLGAWRVLQAAPGPRFLFGQPHPAARWLQTEGGVVFDVIFDTVLDDLPPHGGLPGRCWTPPALVTLFASCPVIH